MRQWYLRTFKKDKIVKIQVAFEDGRLRTFYEIPNDDGTVILSPNLAVLLKEECRLLSEHNIPTYLFTSKSAGAFRIINVNRPNANSIEYPYSAKDFNTAIDEQVTARLIKAASSKRLSSDTFLVLVVVILGFIAFGYYFTEKMNSIIDLINNIDIDPAITGGDIVG